MIILLLREVVCMDSMVDLKALLILVQAQKSFDSVIMKENKYPSAVYMEARGSFSAYCTVETYIRNLLLVKTKKEKEEV